MKPQTKLIYDHLQSGRSITPLQALKKYGCFRLASRVNEIRQAGHDVSTKLITVNEKRFASYSLK